MEDQIRAKFLREIRIRLYRLPVDQLAQLCQLLQRLPVYGLFVSPLGLSWQQVRNSYAAAMVRQTGTRMGAARIMGANRRSIYNWLPLKTKKSPELDALLQDVVTLTTDPTKEGGTP